jgi:ATP-dependent helicase/nuclease subunit B
MALAQKTILVGAASSGKTEAVLRLLHEPRQGGALLLVPGHLLRQYLEARTQNMPRLKRCSFHSLARLVLHTAGVPVQGMTATLRWMLLRAVVRSLVAAGEMPTFAAVAHKPGVLSLLDALIAEMQMSEVDTAALTAARVTPYDAELGTLLHAYVAALDARDLADAPHHLALACRALEDDPALLTDRALLVVDGFDQFTPLQRRFLALVGQRVARSVVTLTGGAENRPALHRFARTYAQLVEQLSPVVTEAVTDIAPSPPPPNPLFAHIEAHLFALNPPPPLATATGDSLRVIEAADREREVRAVLRYVQQTLADGATPAQVVLLYRNGAPYEPLLYEIASEYGVPLQLYHGLPLEQATPVLALFHLLRLSLQNYPRRALVEVWRSIADGRLRVCTEWKTAEGEALAAHVPAALLFPDGTPNMEKAAGVLDRVARRSGVTMGLDAMRGALAWVAASQLDQTTDAGYESLVSPDEAAGVLLLLNAFVAWLAPPSKATTTAYVDWLRQRVAVGSGDGNSDNRWAVVAGALSSILDALSSAAAALDEPAIPYRAFVDEVMLALAGTRYQPDTGEEERVPALPVLAARGVHADYVILMGLSEGEFPPARGGQPVYSRRERRLLAQAGIPLPIVDPADERSLFYEAVLRARRTLVLSRTYLDERGNTLPPSPYLVALCGLVQEQSIIWQRIGAAALPAPEQAGSPQEALVALADVMRDQRETHPAPVAPDAAALAALVQSRGAGWKIAAPLVAHVGRACAIEWHREGIEGAYGCFEGVLDDAALQAELESRFGASHRWSVTQCNDYTTCPFRFAAGHVLRLSTAADPEEGLEVVSRGLIYHAILAHAGRAWVAGGYPFTAPHAPEIMAALHQAADAVLANAPATYGFERGPFWEWEQRSIRRRLEQALHRALYEPPEWASACRPLAIEQGFGGRDGSPPLRLRLAGGEEVLVAGRVDRVDQRDDGALVLIDYKSSATPRSLSETVQGEDAQLPIYMLAVEQVLQPGVDVSHAAFFHLGSGKYSRPLSERERDETLAALQTNVAAVVAGVRGGNFAVQPRADCPMGCAFAGICRLNVAKRDALRE